MLKENKMNNFDRAEKACYERLKNQNKKTDREIELEKKLEIAIGALEYYSDVKTWHPCAISLCSYVDGEVAQRALKEIKECHI